MSSSNDNDLRKKASGFAVSSLVLAILSPLVGMSRDAQVGIAVLGNADFYQEITQAGFEFLSALTMISQRQSKRW